MIFVHIYSVIIDSLYQLCYTFFNEILYNDALVMQITSNHETLSQ